MPDQAPEKDTPHSLMSALAKKGYAYESLLEKEFSNQGLSVIKIESNSLAEKKTKND